MAKKRKVKKPVIIAGAVILFFVLYYAGFKGGIYLQNKDAKPVEDAQAQEQDTRSLMTQIINKKKIYVSDSNIENVKIEENYWSKMTALFTEFAKVRKPSKYEVKYSGYSDDGIRFSTDLVYFRVYNVNKEEYYKVPVATKNELDKLLNESIYTSFGFVKQNKEWKNVKVTYGEKTKTINKWNYNKLSNRMVYKRIVGKVQPEKSKERSRYNFTIEIKGNNYEVRIETMGKDYVKIISGDSEVYYEVTDLLFDYLKDDIFKLEQ